MDDIFHGNPFFRGGVDLLPKQRSDWAFLGVDCPTSYSHLNIEKTGQVRFSGSSAESADCGRPRDLTVIERLASVSIWARNRSLPNAL